MLINVCLDHSGGGGSTRGRDLSAQVAVRMAHWRVTLALAGARFFKCAIEVVRVLYRGLDLDLLRTNLSR